MLRPALVWLVLLGIVFKGSWAEEEAAAAKSKAFCLPAVMKCLEAGNPKGASWTLPKPAQQDFMGTYAEGARSDLEKVGSLVEATAATNAATLNAWFAEHDPDAAAKLPVGDSQRLKRAMAVVEATGRPLAEWQRRQSEAPWVAARFGVVGLMPPREALLAQVVGTIAAPLSGLVNVLSGNMRNLVNLLNNLKEKRS